MRSHPSQDDNYRTTPLTYTTRTQNPSQKPQKTVKKNKTQKNTKQNKTKHHATIGQKRQHSLAKHTRQLTSAKKEAASQELVAELLAELVVVLDRRGLPTRGAGRLTLALCRLTLAL